MEMAASHAPTATPSTYSRRPRRPDGPTTSRLSSVQVARWTGRETTALRHAMRLSIRAFAQLIGVSDRTVSVWERRGRSIRPRPFMQGVLDTALQRSDHATQARFVLLLSAPATEEPVAPTGPRITASSR